MVSSVASEEKDIDYAQIEYTYLERVSNYTQLKEEGEHILKSCLDSTEIKIHTISSRVKEKDSFLRKVEQKQTHTPFEDITDILGLRVVCLFLSDIKKIRDIIFENFEVISEDDKINNPNNSNTFGYMSNHYIVKLKSHYAGYRYDSIKEVPFEIQVRTVSMDAWANISHFLDYKSENDIPPELSRSFNALSGLFYVADTNFEMFFEDSQKNKISLQRDILQIVNEVTQSVYKETDLNLDSLTLYLHTKFHDRKHSDSKIVSSLVNELSSVGYNSIDELDKEIKRGHEAFLQFEAEQQYDGHFTDVGVVRMTLCIVDESFREIKASDDDDKALFEKYAKTILE